MEHSTELRSITEPDFPDVAYLRKFCDGYFDDPDKPPERPAPAARDNWLEPASEAVKDFVNEDWLVPGLLAEDGVSVLGGAPKGGKSTVARALAAAVSTGAQWLGRDVTQGTVIYLALEERLATVTTHLSALGADMSAIYLPRRGRIPPPDRREAALDDLVCDLNPRLLIVDTVTRWATLEDGNNYVAVARALQPLLDLARDRCVHVMLVHHARKSGGRHGAELVGSVSYAATADVILSLHVGARGHRWLRAFGRDDVNLPPTRLLLADTGHVTVAEDNAKERRAMLAERVAEALADGAERTAAELVADLQCRKGELVAALADLRAAGVIVRSGKGARGSPYQFARARADSQ